MEYMGSNHTRKEGDIEQAGPSLSETVYESALAQCMAHD